MDGLNFPQPGRNLLDVRECIGGGCVLLYRMSDIINRALLDRRLHQRS